MSHLTAVWQSTQRSMLSNHLSCQSVPLSTLTKPLDNWANRVAGQCHAVLSSLHVKHTLQAVSRKEATQLIIHLAQQSPCPMSVPACITCLPCCADVYCLFTSMLALCIHMFTYGSLRDLSLHMLQNVLHLLTRFVLRVTKGITLLCRWFCERRRSKKMAAASGSESAARMAVGREQLQCRMLVTLLTTMSFYFPTVFATTLAFFTCYRLDSAVSGAAYRNNAKVSNCS